MFPHYIAAMIAFGFSAIAEGSPSSRADVSDPFQVYAYGPGIGGLPVFSFGGDIFVGDFRRTNNSQAAPLILTAKGSGTWFGSPNTTQPVNSSDLPTWSNLKFAIPAPSSSSHQVGLITNKNDTHALVTSGFGSYGSLLYATTSNGNIETLWYGTPSDYDDIYLLRWNHTDGDGANKVLLSLNKNPPSNK